MEDNTFQSELHAMEQRLTDMEEKINSIDTKLTQVVDAILGNPLTKTGGFVNDIDVMKSEIESLKRKMESHEDFRKRVGWTMGIILGAAILIQYVINIYVNLKH